MGIREVAKLMPRLVGTHLRYLPSLAAALAVALAVAPAVAPAVAQEKAVPDTRQELQLSFAPLVKKTAPAVVNIYTRKVVHQQASPLFNDPIFRRFFGEGFGMPGITRDRIQNSLGSGVMVDPDGIILTNHHVIEGADQITVALSDRREFEASVVNSDERTDLAVLKIDARGEKLPYLQFGDSDGLEVGDLVLAIGDPFGVGQTVTSGIVSALARTKVGVSDFRYFIQTDAAINPGNSGGALIDMKGALVGINAAIYSRTGGSLGIGFAIPSNMAKAVLHAALSGGTMAHPWLGVAAETVTAKAASALGLERPEGVVVNAIHPDSPALVAGLRPGDIVLTANGREIDDAEALNYRIGTLAIGDNVALGVMRGGQRLSLNVNLVAAPERPKRDATRIAGANPLTGATAANLSPALADELGVDDMLTGVIVIEIAQNSPAAQFEFAPGDLVLKVNDTPVDSVATLVSLLGQPSTDWRIAVGRGGRVLNLSVRQ